MKPAFRSRLLYFGAAATVLVVDQLTKSWVVNTIPPYTPTDHFPWLSPILSFTFVRNTGVAFGLFPQLAEILKVLVACVIVGIIFFQRTLPQTEVWLHLALGSVTGGATGNLMDRFTRGFVVDFFDVNFWPFRNYAVFNIADSAIVVGVAVLLLDSFLTPQRKRCLPMPESKTAVVAEPMRLDQFLVQTWPGLDRGLVRQMVGGSGVLVNGQPALKAGQRVQTGDEVTANVPDVVKDATGLRCASLAVIRTLRG